MTATVIRAGQLRARILRLLAVACLVLTPAVGFFAGLRYLHFSLADYTPAVPNDEFVHFLESQAWLKYGFQTGYFLIDERPAAASFTHFGIHGPVFAMFYGTLGRIFGLSFASGPVFNVWVISLALVIYCALTRPSWKRALWLAAFFLTFWPYYGFAYGWMEDTTHLAIAVILGGIFTVQLSGTPLSRSIVFRASAVLFVCAAALMRVSWALLLPPLCLLFLERPTWKSAAMTLAASLLGVLALVSTFSWLCSPWSEPVTGFMVLKVLTGKANPEVLVERIWVNIGNLGRIASWLEWVVYDEHWSALLLAGGVSAVAAFARYFPWKWPRSLWPGVADHPRELWLCCYNQAVITLGTVTTYYVTAEGSAQRMFAIHLMVTLLVAAAAQRWGLRLLFFAVLIYNVGMWAPCLAAVGAAHKRDFHSAPLVAAFREKIRDVIVWTPSADPWENTLLVDRLPPDLAGLTPGVGVSLILTPDTLSRAKSRYILVSPARMAEAKIKVKLLRKMEGVHEQFPPYDDQEPYLYLNLSKAQ